MGKRLTYYILIGLVLGGIVGLGVNAYFDDMAARGPSRPRISRAISRS